MTASEGRARLELHLGEMRQLFNSMDPAPFRERDLDPKACDYIVDWAEERSRDQPLALGVYLSRQQPAPGDEALLGAAVREYFRGRAAVKRHELSRLFRMGRLSLVIGLAFLAGANLLARWLGSLITDEGSSWLVSESLVIGGWVALWRPMEVFLYDWWPIRADAKLFDRLAAMPVDLRGADTAMGGAA